MFIGHFEGIAEAIRRDQRRTRALAFNQRISRKGRTVNNQCQVRRADAGLRQYRRSTFQHRAFGCI